MRSTTLAMALGAESFCQRLGATRAHSLNKIDRLLSKSVTVTARPDDDFSAAATIAGWVYYFISLVLLFGGLWLVMARPGVGACSAA
jgi:hypothetical protein